MKEMWPLNTRILRGGEKTGDKGDGHKLCPSGREEGGAWG